MDDRRKLRVENQAGNAERTQSSADSQAQKAKLSAKIPGELSAGARAQIAERLPALGRLRSVCLCGFFRSTLCTQLYDLVALHATLCSSLGLTLCAWPSALGCVRSAFFARLSALSSLRASLCNWTPGPNCASLSALGRLRSILCTRLLPFGSLR